MGWADEGGTVTTPWVADLDGDGKPEIVFSAYDLVALHGDDCSVAWVRKKALPSLSEIAIADLDGDGVPEIVGVGDQEVLVHDNTGLVLASLRLPVSNTGIVSIADVDGEGPAEILVDEYVLRYRPGLAYLEVVSKHPKDPKSGLLSTFADLDGDGVPEIVSGGRIYDPLTGGDRTPAALSLGVSADLTFPAVADLDGDGAPDVVNVEALIGGSLSIFSYRANRLLFDQPIFLGMGAGAPVIADFDADGGPDVGFAVPLGYAVYSLKCNQDPRPVECVGGLPGLLWSTPFEDLASSAVGSTVFDFNGDGRPEIVYRDDCWLRILDGMTGEILFARPLTSVTRGEVLVVADADGDGHADIVVGSGPSGNGCPHPREAATHVRWTGDTRGVFVFSNPSWASTRPLWTSYNYHVTDVNDDLSIPTQESPSWVSPNTFRRNIQGPAPARDKTSVPLPDLTAGFPTPAETAVPDPPDGQVLWAKICNRGAGEARPGVAGTFYDAERSTPDPKRLCTAVTTGALAPGGCETVWCKPAIDCSGPKVWFYANDHGNQSNQHSECNEKNNGLFPVLCSSANG